MEIKQRDDGNKGSFYIEIDGKKAAESTYVWAGIDKIIIDHTEVSEVLKGKNAGKQLVSKAVEFARAKNIKILPLCPFAAAIFRKTPDYKDVLA
ncbi:MAG: GNAT family N-acetyltransferase [Chryseolinea sp.]